MPASPRFVKFGDYILLHRLAKGGMAEIHLAFDERPATESQRVVIKRLAPHQPLAPLGAYLLGIGGPVLQAEQILLVVGEVDAACCSPG